MTGIEIIKEIRNETGATLAQARDLWERLRDRGAFRCTDLTTPLLKSSPERRTFAAMIYQGMNSIPDSIENRKISAAIAVECADALIAELDKDINAQKPVVSSKE